MMICGLQKSKISILPDAFVIVALLFSFAMARPFAHLTVMKETAPHYGVYQVQFSHSHLNFDPYLEHDLAVEWTQPDGETITCEAFYDGEGIFKARAYCRQRGEWRWRSVSRHSHLDGKFGSFTVIPSQLQGKLQISKQDPYQFVYDNGTWFLHIGDTGYRYVVQSEPFWRDYIDQAAKSGITKIRTWFCQSRSTVEHLFVQDRSAPHLDYWQEIDRRIIYALEKYPHIILQLIPYGEDTEELKRYAQGDQMSQWVARYSQARWSAFPNIYWCVSNDRQIVQNPPLKGRQILASTIDRIGRDMFRQETWNTLITNHQARFSGYDFLDAYWSQIITLEDLDQVAGTIIQEYRPKGSHPVINDEDRYECYRDAGNKRYFFRRLMWASLLSGGHATYGGLRTYEAYDGGDRRGVQGYYDACERGTLAQGAHDFNHIHEFFKKSGLDLIGMQPDDGFVSGDSLHFKCCHDDTDILIYCANPTGSTPRTDNPAAKKPQITVKLSAEKTLQTWFNPRTGEWRNGKDVSAGEHILEPPGNDRINWGDWLLWLHREI
ncbi:DUF4038 domain-containing protein [candidate division KSB1 bacterium]|nr:DUF4038 domain-containing protein [candidate division KSB1 bacterium]